MKITLKKHPELKLANEFLNTFPKAIIAGGVARDLINGKEFKDVDIFLAAPVPVELAKVSMEIGCFATAINEKPTFLESYYKINTLVRIGISNLDICVVQEIFNGAESLISAFDMVSSQAWLEPVKDGFEVKATDLFHQLNKKKVLGFYECVADSSDHIARVKEKYPDYLPLSLAQPKEPFYEPQCPF